MDLIEAANRLLKFGSILGMVLGLLSTLFWVYFIIIGLGPPFFVVNLYEVLLAIFSVAALLLSYFVLTRFPGRIRLDPSRSALYLVGIGFIIAIGSWGIAGLLIVIAAILVLIDETS
ncbi:MAG: hypothetical protein ACFFCF_06925 [Promethearchaeota archaeon]